MVLLCCTQVRVRAGYSLGTKDVAANTRLADLLLPPPPSAGEDATSASAGEDAGEDNGAITRRRLRASQSLAKIAVYQCESVAGVVQPNSRL